MTPVRAAATPRVPADELLTGFAAALSHAGVSVTPDRTQSYLRACALLDAGDPAGVYWAGRATLCSRPDDVEAYDRVFAGWFTGDLGGDLRQPARRRATVRVVEAAFGGMAGESTEEPDEPAIAGAQASDVEVLRHRDIAELTAQERELLHRQFRGLRPLPAQRKSSRRRPAGRGEVDAHRTLRAQLRGGGEPSRLHYRRRTTRPRRTVLLIDVSGSMAPYADSLLRLAHRITRAAPRHTEVFTTGTRLTRVSRALRVRDPEAALRAAAEAVPDWSGGTRLGEVLGTFLTRWGQRGPARGAVVVIFSDGWERGDCALLGRHMARLAALAHRVVWVNPHRGSPDYEPLQAGMVAALPYVDDFVAGHSLDSFAKVLEVIGDA